MSRRSTPLLPRSQDGASQRARQLPALDPAHAPIDERTSADVLRFVQGFAARLRYFEAGDAEGEVRAAGTWSAFASGADVSVDDVVAYASDPARFAGERARWLGRPHFALLVAFVELLRHAREQLNGLTRRHLDHHFREVLRLGPQPSVPDRAAVVFGLRAGAIEVRLPAGTELQAGRDGAGVPRVYRTERDVTVNRAAVASLRSVLVDRRITGIPDVREDRDLTAPAALVGTIRMALGSPRPGDPVPPLDGRAVDTAFVLGLRPLLDFADRSLHLAHHELRSLMRLVRRRREGVEWTEINRLLGVASPPDPRDFAANLARRVGVLDFRADGLPQVSSVDDLYAFRTEPAVRSYIETRLAPIGYERFVALMALKLRVDGEWAEINRLLERMGARQRRVLEWSLPAGKPTDFAGNLALALDGGWPPPWPAQANGIDAYDALLRRLEAHLSMAVERIGALVAFAEEVQSDPASEKHDWSEIDRILADAHREKVRAGRCARLVGVRDGRADAQAFDRVASFVLGLDTTLPWPDARGRLADHLDPAQLTLLARFRDELSAPGGVPGAFGWPDADRLLELAWRDVEGLPEPVAERTELRNVYAFDDATQVKEEDGVAWKTFGLTPPRSSEARPEGATLGFAIRSAALALSEGRRLITLTFGLRRDGFDATALLAALGLGAGERAGARLVAALQDALPVEVSTEKGWVRLPVDGARLGAGGAGDDYWAVRGAGRPQGAEDRPALQLTIVADPSFPALAPPKGARERWPTLRLTLRPRWDGDAAEWRTAMGAFEPLALAAVHLKVEVDGLSALRLQHEDRLLDPRKPFEPFGSRPAVGARLYLDHPELVRARLDRLRFDVEWMGLPESLDTLYQAYGTSPSRSTSTLKAAIALVDRNVELPLASGTLFAASGDKTATARSLSVPDVPAAIAAAAPGWTYARRTELPDAGDVRLASRHLRWELTPVDFGHAVYPSLAAAKARLLAIAISKGTADPANDGAAYRVDPPYTPTIKRLSVAYGTSLELDPSAATGDDRLLHVHPFGEAEIDPASPTFLPRYPDAGELYVGLRDLRPPTHVALLVQLAEGTSDPDVPAAPVRWSYLAGDRFVDLAKGDVIHDSTRGLLNSGIVELALPAAATTGRLPPGLSWIRLAIPRSTRSVCDAVAIRAQAVSVRFDDRGNAPAHYEQPLPVGSIDRLRRPDARVATVEQPFTSWGGKPPERPERFDARVAERLRHRQRAVAPWDYERLVLQEFPQIYRARCLSRGDGVDVVVVPDVRALHPSDTFAPNAPASLLGEIQRYLAARAPAAARLRVRNARYVAVRVRLGVRFRAGEDEGAAQRRLNADLVRFLSPWAFDEGAELMIGGRIYANSVVDFVDRRDDVDYVAKIELFRSLDGRDFDLVRPEQDGHYVRTTAPDQVLVAARQHDFDVIPEAGYEQASFTGIGYMRIELDFIVG